MGILSKYSSSTQLAEDGKEFQLSEDGFVTLRRADSKLVKDATARWEKKFGFGTLRQAGVTLPEDKQRTVLVKVAAEAMIVSWRGADWIDEDTGKLMACTPENIETILEDRDHDPLLGALYNLSQNYQNFRVEEAKELEKNS